MWLPIDIQQVWFILILILFIFFLEVLDWEDSISAHLTDRSCYGNVGYMLCGGKGYSECISALKHIHQYFDENFPVGDVQPYECSVSAGMESVVISTQMLTPVMYSVAI
jgi:hypothetical protein